MASELLNRYNDSDSRSKAAVTLETLMDDATEQAGSNREKNDGQEVEILVKWQIPGNHDASAAKRKLTQVLATLMVSFPNSVVIIDRKKREWVYQEVVDEELFKQQLDNIAIQLHPIKNKDQKVIRWVTIIKMRTTTTIQEWKNDDEFYTQASEAKIYMFPHPFGYDEWDVASIGFIKDHHAVHYPKEFLQDKISRLLREQTSSPPVFQLIPQRVTTKDNKATTKAYTVQCVKHKSNLLIQLLTHGVFRQTHNQIFVPFKYKATQPDLFLNCIRQQNDIYHRTWIIKVEGITSHAMSMIEPELLRMKGVFHVVPSKRVDTIGEWKILVEQTKCYYIHRSLIKGWLELMARVPADIWEQAPAGFPIPSVSSQRVREYQDDASDIDSYGSLLSVGTDATTPEETALDELPITYQYPTYASVAGTAESSSSTASTQISSPTASAYVDWQKEKQELENQLQKQAALFEQELDNRFQKYTQLIEQLQSEIQEKITRSQDLEEKLAQAIELAYDRDNRHEEMMQRFDTLMRMQGNPPTETSVPLTLPPTTPIRANPSPSSPPPKRKNTNTTPHRDMYSIFRSTNPGSNTKPTHGQTLTQHRNPKPSPPSGPEATMEIDETQICNAPTGMNEE